MSYDTTILAQASPPRLADCICEELERCTGVPGAVYVVELEGRELELLSGEGFPSSIPIGRTMGSELSTVHEDALRESIHQAIPDVHVRPLWRQGIAFVVLVSQAPLIDFDSFADAAALTFDAAQERTDVFEIARRRKRTTAAAELQAGLCPPAAAIVRGATLAASILPAYTVGGDWFDWTDNRDELRFSVADVSGKGDEAMAVGALALSALRATRRNEEGLERAAEAIHETLQPLPGDRFLTGIFARYEHGTRQLTWINCGHPDPLLIHPDGSIEELTGARHHPLGVLDRAPMECETRTLQPGDRVLLYSDGVTERRLEDGTRLGLDALMQALHHAGPTAAHAIVAVLRHVEDASSAEIDDDATIVAVRVD